MENSLRTLIDVQTLLKITYGVVPIVVGAHKFTNLLADWGRYLNPSLEAILPFNPQVFKISATLKEQVI